MTGAAPVRPSLPADLRAWVVFCGEADMPWLRLLRPGFRHCFVVLNDGRHWITVDPLSPHTEIAVQPTPPGFDLIGWFAGRGQAVAAAAIRRDRRRPAPWAPFTCVEAVKRVLGLHARFVVTPWQLYRHLTRPGSPRPPIAQL
jgi:hypothetical protein